MIETLKTSAVKFLLRTAFRFSFTNEKKYNVTYTADSRSIKTTQIIYTVQYMNEICTNY